MVDFKKIKEKIDSICKKKGLADYKIVYSSSSELQASAVGRALNDTSSSADSILSFTAVVGGRGGSSSASSFEDEDLENLVTDAIDNALSLEGKNECIIYEGSESYADIKKPPFSQSPMKDIVKKTLELQNAMMDSDPRVLEGSESGVYSQAGRICLANSKGLLLEQNYGYEGFQMMASVKEGTEAATGEDDGIGPIAQMKMDKCVKEALSKLHAKKTSSGLRPVVLSKDCVAQILVAFVGIFIGKSAILGLSFLKGKEGEKIASDLVTLTDDPFEESSPVQIHFDADGVATRKKNIIENGVLKTLLYNLSSARLAGKQSTGNAGPYLGSSETGIFSFYLKPGKKTLEELFAQAGENCLYVQEMKSHAGTNAATGDFSIECAGFEIENGKQATPVKSFTIAGNFYQVLKDISGLSNDLKWTRPFGFARIGAPDVLVSKISVAG